MKEVKIMSKNYAELALKVHEENKGKIISVVPYEDFNYMSDVLQESQN